MTKYYMVGRVPVELSRRKDGSVMLLAFSPTSGQFTSDARYYSEIQRNDSGRVREIPQAEYQQRLAHLQAS